MLLMAVARSFSGDVVVRYVLLFLYDVMFAHSGPYRGLSIQAERVTSLHRRAQDNAPAASHWLRRVLDDGGRARS